MNKITIYILILAVMVVGVIAFIGFNKTDNLSGVQWYSGTTNTSSTISTTASSILSGDSGRTYVSIVNDGGNNVYLHFIATSTGVTAQNGIRLNANGGSFEIDQNNSYTGQIYAITQSGTSTLTIVNK